METTRELIQLRKVELEQKIETLRATIQELMPLKAELEIIDNVLEMLDKAPKYPSQTNL